MPNPTLRTRLFLTAFLLTIILANLAASIPPSAASKGNDNSESPLLLYMFKIRREMGWERQWAKADPITYYDSTKNEWRTTNLPSRYLIVPRSPNTAPTTLPDDMNPWSWFLHDYAEGAIIPSSELVKLAKHKVPQMCHLMNGYFGALYQEFFKENVSSDFNDYLIWFGNTTKIVDPFSGSLSIYYLYPFDYIPVYLYEGDAYLNWCLSPSAVTPPTLTDYANIGANVTYATASPSLSGSAAFLSIADYLSLTGIEEPLTEAANIYLSGIDYWRGLNEDLLRVLLRYHVLFDAYLPIYEERVATKYVNVRYPLDESFIFTLYPSEWWGTTTGLFPTELVESVNGTVPMVPFTYDYPTGFMRAVMERSSTVNLTDYSTIYTLYYGEHPATQLGDRTYTVTIWVYGPGYIAHASPNPYIDKYLPEGLDYFYTRPAFTYLMKEVERDESLARSNPLLGVATFISNNSVPIPSNYTAILGTPFYWVAPDSEPTKSVKVVFNPKKPVESMRALTFVFYTDPNELQLWQTDPVIFIKISDGERSWIKKVKISPGDPVYRFARPEKPLGPTTVSWDYTDSFSFKGLLSEGLETKAEIHGEIGIERHYSVSIEPQHVAYMEGSSVYDFIMTQKMNDRIWVLTQSIDYPSMHVYNIPFIRDDPNPSSKYWFGYFNEPVEMKRDLSIKSVQRVILGGSSPFPNYGAVPYWIPSFPSPLLPPAKTPTAEGLLKLTGYPNNPPLPQELVGEFSRLLGNIANQDVYDDLYNYLKYVYARELSNYSYTGTQPRATTSSGVRWAYQVLGNTPDTLAWVTYAPSLITDVVITSTTRIGPMPPYMRLWSLDRESIDKLPASMANLKTGFWHTASVSVIADRVAGSAVLYNLLDQDIRVPLESIIAFTQYPLVKLYNLTLPYPTGRARNIVLNSSDYGWGSTAPDKVFWPSGFSWLKSNVPDWALGMGLKGVMQVSGASYATYTPGFRYNLVDGYVERVGSKLVSSRTDTLISKAVAANFNPFWIPLGDGVQEVPVFYQVMAPVAMTHELWPSFGINYRPFKAFSPGDECIVNAFFFGEEPPGNRVILEIDTKGFPSPFIEGDTVEIPLSMDSSGRWRGSVVLHVLGPETMEEVFRDYGDPWIDVVLNAHLGPYHSSMIARVFVSGTVVLQLVEAGVEEVPESPEGVLEPSSVIPNRDSLAWLASPQFGPYERLIEKAIIVLENGTYTYTKEFNITDKGFSKGIFSVSDVPRGSYNLSLELLLRYGPPFMRELYLQNYTDYWEFERELLENEPWMIRKARIRLRIGEVEVGNEPKSFTVLFPFTRVSELLGAIETLSGDYVVTLPNGRNFLVLYGPRNPLQPQLEKVGSVGWYGSPEDELVWLAGLLGYRELADIIEYSFGLGARDYATNITGMDALYFAYIGTHYEPELAPAAQELKSLLREGINAWVVEEEPSNNVLYTYEALDALHVLMVVAPSTIASWGYFLGYHAALATFTVAGMYDYQAMYGTADLTSPRSVIDSLLDKLGISWPSAVNALQPLTALPSTPQASVSYDVRRLASYVISPHYGSVANLTSMEGAWVDVLAAWLWNRLYSGVHRYDSLFFIAADASATVLTEAYLRGVRGSIPSIIHSMATGATAERKMYGEFRHLIYESGAGWEPPLEEFEKYMFEPGGKGRRDVLYVILAYNLGRVLNPKEMPSPVTDDVGNDILRPDPLGSGSMVGLTEYYTYPQRTLVNGTRVSWVYEPGPYTRVTAANTYAVSAMYTQLGLDAAVTATLSAASIAGLMIAQASSWVIEDSAHLPVVKWREMIDEVRTELLYDVRYGYPSVSHPYRTMMQKLGDAASNGYGGLVGEMLAQAYEIMKAGEVIDGIQYPPFNITYAKISNKTGDNISIRFANGFKGSVETSPVLGQLKIYAYLIKFGQIVHAFLGAISEMGDSEYTRGLVDINDTIGRSLVMSKVYAAGADALTVEYGRWIAALLTGDLVNEGYHKYLAKEAFTLYARSLLNALEVYDELAKNYPNPESLLREYRGWPYVSYAEEGVMYPLMLLGSEKKDGDTIKVEPPAKIIVISPGDNVGCGTVFSVMGQKEDGGWEMNTATIMDGPGHTYTCYYAIADPGEGSNAAHIIVTGEEPPHPRAHIAMLAKAGSSEPFTMAGYFSPHAYKMKSNDFLPYPLIGSDGRMAVTSMYPPHPAFMGYSVDVDIVIDKTNISNSHEDIKFDLLLEYDKKYVGASTEMAVYSYIVWVNSSVLYNSSAKSLGLVPDLASASAYIFPIIKNNKAIIHYKPIVSLIPIKDGALIIVGVIAELEETDDSITFPELNDILIRIPLVKYSKKDVTLTGGGTSVDVEGLGSVTASSNGTSSITFIPGNRLVKIKVGGSPTNLLIPATQGINVTVIVEGEEIPIDVEEVVHEGARYYSVTLPPGEAVIRYGKSEGTETTTTTQVTTTTAATTTTTTGGAETTTGTQAPPKQGQPAWLIPAASAAVAAAAALVAIWWRRR